MIRARVDETLRQVAHQFNGAYKRHRLATLAAGHRVVVSYGDALTRLRLAVRGSIERGEALELNAPGVLLHSSSESMMSTPVETTSWLIPRDEWHPLSGLPAPEYIPPQWDGLRVGRRLIEAFRTLALMPIASAPRAFGSTWPVYAQEAVDYFAARVDGDSISTELEEIRNRGRLVPSGVAIQRMETAIAWPAHYLASRAMLLVIVQEVAALRAHSAAASLERIARRLRRGPTYLRRCNRAGLDLIAAGLRRDEVAVF